MGLYHEHQHCPHGRANARPQPRISQTLAIRAITTALNRAPAYAIGGVMITPNNDLWIELVAALEEAQPYITHVGWCAAVKATGPCDCGTTATLDRVEAALKRAHGDAL